MKPHLGLFTGLGLVLLFSGYNIQAQSRFSGGSGSGYASATTVGSLSEESGMAAKYRGGAAAGYYSLGPVAGSLSSSSFSASKFMGGSGQGYAQTTFSGGLDSVLFSASKFRGGSGQGYAQATSGPALDAIAFSASKYYGGSGSGYAAAVGDFTLHEDFGIYKYMGGSGQGYASVKLDTNLNLRDNQVSSKYLGGSGQGYANAVISTAVNAPALLSDKYHGGNGQGYVSSSINSGLSSTAFTASKYYGGNGQGYTNSQTSGSLDNSLFASAKFNGGSGQGYTASDVYSGSNNADFLSARYFGGTGQGYAMLGRSTGLLNDDVIIPCTSPLEPPVISASGPLSFCLGDSVTLTSSYENGNTWSNGSVQTFVKVKTSGKYAVTYSTAEGCKAYSDTVTVTVNPKPAAPAITVSGDTTLCSGDSVLLTASSAANYIWSNGKTTQAVYAKTSGSYYLRTVSGACYSDTSAKVRILVKPRPSVSGVSASGPLTFCSGGSVTLTASGAANYLWSNGAVSPAITVAESGSYTVQAVANGCTSSASPATVVTVNPTPGRLSITVSGDTTFCSGDSVLLTASSAANYIWSNGKTAQAFYAKTSGSYYVRTLAGTCYSDTSAKVHVTVKPRPAITGIAESGPLTFCSGSSVTLTATASGALSYLWSNGEVTPAITVSESGSYSVQAVANGCTSAVSVLKTVTVNPVPNADISASGPLTFCTGGSVTLTATGGMSYLWSNGATTATLNVTISGSYTVQAISNGCTSAISAVKTVTVNPVPTVDVSASGPLTFCTGGSVTLSATGGTTYLWSNGLATSSITVSESGTYSVLAISNGCTSASGEPVAVTVNEVPGTSLITSPGGTVICPSGSITLSSSAATGNLWSNGATTQSITVTTAGNYTVKSIASGCTSQVSNIVTVSTGSLPAAAGAISGNAAPLQGYTYSYSVPPISGASNYSWQYSGTGVSITGSGSGISLNMGANATSGTLSVYGSAYCGNGPASNLAITVSPDTLHDLVITSDTVIHGSYRNITIVGSPVKVTLNGDLSVAGSFNVTAGNTFISACNKVSGPGSFSLSASASIEICNTDGIAQSGNSGAIQTTGRSFSNAADYTYNGTVAQLTGTGLPARVRNLTANNSAGLTLSSATSVQNTLGINAGTFNLNGKALTLLSAKTGTARLAEVPAGAGFSNASAFTVQRWLDSSAVRNELQGFGAYYWLGTSVAGKTVNSWNTANNPYVYTSYDAQSHYGSVWLYSSSYNAVPANSGWFKPASATVPVNSGSGVRIWFNNGFFATGAVASLSGAPVTGNLSLPVNYCAANCAGNTSANGWSLIGNPYPSTIDWNDPDWTKTNMADALYIWRHKQNAYSTYVNGVGTIGGSNLLASGQGFMVKATGANPVLTAREGVKTANLTPNLREGALSLLRLELKAGSFYDEAVIVNRPGSVRDYEPANDAGKYMNPALNIWSEPNTGSKQAIASMLPEVGDTIAIRLKSNTAQTLSLTATDFTDWASLFSLYIRDNENQTIQPLQLNSPLFFSVNASEAYKLTLLLRPADATGTAAKQLPVISVMPNPSNGVFTITCGSNMQLAEIYDNLGRLVHRQVVNGKTAGISLHLASGVYTLKAGINGHTAVSRLVIE
ncbi:MAG: T9SS type A sorting domain-containing protein [Bacteroidota bacterium]